MEEQNKPIFNQFFPYGYHMGRLVQKELIIVRLQCERYLIAGIDYVLYYVFGVTTATHTGITVFISLLMFTLALCLIQNCLIQKIKAESVLEKLAFYAITALVFINVLFGEMPMFGECAIMFGLAYLLSAGGIHFFTKKKYWLSFLFFLISTTSYQVAVVFGAIILSAWIFMENEYKITAKTVKEEFLCGILTFGSGLLNMISGEILRKLGAVDWLMKDAGGGDFALKLQQCSENFVMLLRNNKGVLPGVWLPLFMLLFSCGITVYVFIRKKKPLGYYCLLVPALIVMLYVISMAQRYVYLPPRIMVPFYTVEAMLLLIAFRAAEGNLKQLVCYAACGFLLIQILYCNITVASRMVTNNLDRTYASMVYEKILEYEESTGNQVTKLAVVNDIDCPFSYNSVHYKTDQINERALGTVTNTLVNVVTGRYFKKVTMDEEIYKTYFEGKNWDYFDASEQLMIEGDTAYWAIF